MEVDMTPHVLLLDNNVELSHMYSRAFRTRGCETRAIYDAETALRELKEGDFVPDVIVMDVMMPNMNGVQFLTEIRKDERFENVPVIALTNMRNDEYTEKFPEPAIDLFLNKLDHELSDVVERVIDIVTKHQA